MSRIGECKENETKDIRRRREEKRRGFCKREKDGAEMLVREVSEASE